MMAVGRAAPSCLNYRRYQNPMIRLSSDEMDCLTSRDRAQENVYSTVSFWGIRSGVLLGAGLVRAGEGAIRAQCSYCRQGYIPLLSGIADNSKSYKSAGQQQLECLQSLNETALIWMLSGASHNMSFRM
jgi:hypothetical protein